MNPRVFQQIVDNPDMFVKDGNGYRRPTLADNGCTIYTKVDRGPCRVVIEGSGDAETPPSTEYRRSRPSSDIPPGQPPPGTEHRRDPDPPRAGNPPPRTPRSEAASEADPASGMDGLADTIQEGAAVISKGIDCVWWLTWRGCGCGFLVLAILLIVVAVINAISHPAAVWLTK